ncbi:MAG: acyltransferase family protein [Nitrospirota bacterium]
MDRQDRISSNFNALKALSILAVVAGHFLGDLPLLWVPATFGLLVFAYSSAYFTARKYRGRFDLKVYWSRKVYRLGIDLLVINLFLLCLFILQGRKGILSWHTAVNAAGLNGFLNWFRIPNESPFGAGMWFFTLLLLFYGIYPLMNRVLKNRTVISLFFVSAIGLLWWLHHTVVYGHMLWLTTGGFLYGFVAARADLRMSASGAAGASILLFLLLFIANSLFKIKLFNFILLFALFCSGMLLVEHLRLHSALLSFFSKYIFEIYLLHSYLFFEVTGTRLVDVPLSFLMVLIAAVILARLSFFIKEAITKRRAAAKSIQYTIST